MGAKQKRLAWLKENQPICFFCGKNGTETEDHVPSRACFRGGIGPEGYGFPACKNCNHSASQHEQAVALYIHTVNLDGITPVAGQFAKLFGGVKNNTPRFSPSMIRNTRTSRNFMKKQGIPLMPGQTYAEVALAELPAESREAFDLFARRLTCALHYKHVGFPIPLEHFIVSTALPWSHPNAVKAVAECVALFPNVERGSRKNTDIGDQFIYRWLWSADEKTFGFTAQFSNSFYFAGSSAPYAPNGNTDWKSHHEDVPWVGFN